MSVETAPPRPLQRSRDRGSITAFVVVITMAVMACAGLAVDGARVVGAKVDAADHAENAARAGAQELTALRGDGPPHLDPVRARLAAESYLAAQGVMGEVTVTADRITVTVHRTISTTLLRLVGISSKTVTATRSSVALVQ
jgi:hypothetical protein